MVRRGKRAPGGHPSAHCTSPIIAPGRLSVALRLPISHDRTGKCLLWFQFPAIIERFSGSEPPVFKDYSMVIIRLARGGSKKRPFYNIVATDSRNRRDGRFIERVGFYNPVATKGESLRIAQDRLTYWQGVGAQLSPTVERLVKQAQKAQPAA